jgi:ubiquitin carboxyl-terminal hydrolase L3
MGLYHCLANAPKYVQILEGPFNSYLRACEGKSLEQKAKIMEDDKDLKDIHSKNAQSGQTDAPNAEDNVDLHFISFVEVDGDIYEMDGFYF